MDLLLKKKCKDVVRYCSEKLFFIIDILISLFDKNPLKVVKLKMI
jgi:hypothetical protein